MFIPVHGGSVGAEVQFAAILEEGKGLRANSEKVIYCSGKTMFRLFENEGLLTCWSM